MLQVFQEKVPGVIVEANFLRTLSYVIKLLCETGTIKRKSGSRTIIKRTFKDFVNVRQVI